MLVIFARICVRFCPYLCPLLSVSVSTFVPVKIFFLFSFFFLLCFSIELLSRFFFVWQLDASCSPLPLNSLQTWDVVLPTKEQVSKLAETCIQTISCRLHPEYMGTRRVQITVCNVPVNLPGEVIVSYLSAFGRTEEMTQMRATAGTAQGDHGFQLCLDRGGFQAISDTFYFKHRLVVVVVVEGRRPRYWSCKQVGHLAKVHLERWKNLPQNHQYHQSHPRQHKSHQRHHL